MNPVVEAALKSWNLNIEVLVLLVFTGLIYLRGWRFLHRQMPQRFTAPRLASFLIGLAVIFLAIASPLDAFANLLLTAHMIQHLLLMMVVPPLILYSDPFLPLLRGLPVKVSKDGLGPFLASKSLQRFGRNLTHPVVCWFAFTVMTVAWHIPVLFELALHSPFWHQVEHSCFLATATLFWYPVMQPWPSKPQLPRWTMIPYLFLADFQNTGLSAFLSFYDRAIYLTYAQAPRLFGLSAVQDQAAAGAIMWVPGSMVFLVAVGLITIEVLSSRRRLVRPSSLLQPPSAANRSAQFVQLTRRRQSTARDLLSTPLIGNLLRSRYFRRTAQTIMLILALLIVADGLFGHQMSGMNLAGVLPWTHWRGLSIITLLIAGNFFCMTCPFMLTRDLGRRFLPAGWRYPQWLRSKWLAVALLAIYLWAYEAFSLWDSPWLTAWIIIGYFASSFIIDGLFQGANFCKYVCPIGQFNFVQSLVSPLEVKARNLEICQTCTTHDCLRGNNGQRGCELQLFLPAKVGNLDCTFCLDCQRACPHQNVGILSVIPASTLFADRRRSSIGRLSQRTDVAALMLLLVFGAFVNAAGMTRPVNTWEQALQNRFGFASSLPVLTALFLFVLIIIPAALAGVCGLLSRVCSQEGWKKLTCSFVAALVPLGFSMWLAHLLYHLLTAGSAIVPVMQRAAIDMGIGFLGAPDWSAMSMLVPMEWITSLQILLLNMGLLLTLYVGWRTALRMATGLRNTFALLLPWAGLAVALYLAGLWILFQPMQMRGMLHAMM
jgi:cytochrome c oxidase assembly factor CtaG